MISANKHQIWVEAEEWVAGEWNPTDGNSDVIVTLDDGTKWIASFFTYENIVSLSEKNKVTGECLDGKYLWASDMILVDELTRSRVETVVNHLLEEGSFESIFDEIEPKESL